MKIMLKKNWIFIVLVLAIGIFIGRVSKNTADKENESGQTKNIGNKEQIWTCSMHPHVKQDSPGKCPICGMELIPLNNSSTFEESDPDEISISESAMKLAEIQTYLVKKEHPEKELRLLGKVKADERLVFSQTIHFPGRIEKLFINFTGEKVKRGQKLASVYSTELVMAQKELFEVLKDKSTNPILVKAARNKLKQWKLTENQILKIEKSGKIHTNIDILSDYNGYVTTKKVSEGDHFKQGEVLFEITDLSRVWVLFEAYENDLPWIKKGDEIKIEFRSLPGEKIDGKVSFIDPFINPKTRITHVRMELPNPKGKLKPDMFASGVLNSKLSLKEEAILIPKSAVLWTGKRAIVYVKNPEKKTNTFIYREVTLGEDAGDFYIVKKGLQNGEEIASNGVFRIDASAQLAGKKSMMNPEGSSKNEKSVNSLKINNINQFEIDEPKVPNHFKEQIGMVVGSYLSLKDKLANDNPNIKEDAKNLQIAIKKVDQDLIQGNAQKIWKQNFKGMIKDVNLLIDEKNIDRQRDLFLTLSHSLYDVVNKLGLILDSEKILYLQFCPMANNNKGGYWFSLEKNILNPYFGSKMSNCGDIKDTFNKRS